MRRKYHVNVSEAAERDVRQIHDYIAGDKPRAAQKWVRDFERNARSLTLMPLKHAIIPESLALPVDFRQVLLGNYRIIFEIAQDEVTILRVVHAAKQLDESYFERT